MKKTRWNRVLVVFLFFTFTGCFPDENIETSFISKNEQHLLPTAPKWERVGVDSFNKEAIDGSQRVCHVSYDGRYVMFESAATNLVSGDTNGFSDIFLKDRQLGTTTLLSVKADGTQANGDSQCGADSRGMSADGNWAVFVSDATNLLSDITLTTNFKNVYLLHVPTGKIQMLNAPYQFPDRMPEIDSGDVRISNDGQFVVFASEDRFIGSVPRTSWMRSLYLYDMKKSSVSMLTGGLNYVGEPDISADGRYIVFSTHDELDFKKPRSISYFTQVILLDVFYMTSTKLLYNPPITDQYPTLFLNTKPTIDDWGTRVGYTTTITYEDLPDFSSAYVYDVKSKKTISVDRDSSGNLANGTVFQTVISPTGTQVLFTSSADNLSLVDTSGQTNVYLHNLNLGQTDLVSSATFLSLANGPSKQPVFSGDERFVSLASLASNLVTDDKNGLVDAFIVPLNHSPKSDFVANFVYKSTPPFYDSLNLSLDGSKSVDDDGTVESWDWDFGDGKTGTGMTLVHKYTAPGSYDVTLIVTDNKGAIGKKTRTIVMY